MRHGKPAPPPVPRKHRLSEHYMVPQMQSSFLMKLPLEIRQIIYEDVIKDGSLHRHIIELQDSVPREHRRSRIVLCGTGCTQGQERGCVTRLKTDVTTNFCEVRENRIEKRFWKNDTSHGSLALAKSCRQLYLETIDIYYGEQLDVVLNLGLDSVEIDRHAERQVFCFSHLHDPPYFITSTLPQRLAKIRHVHIHYNQYKSHSSEFDPKCLIARRCDTCNLCPWLKAIIESMTGLQSVELSHYLSGNDFSYPNLKEAWVIQLLELQRRSKALIKFVALPRAGIALEPGSEVAELMKRRDVLGALLQNELNRVREAHDETNLDA